MAKREDAVYRFGADKILMFPHNADGKRASYSRMLGDAGALDFSSAEDPDAVPGVIRVDGGEELDFTIDISAAAAGVDEVTPAEWAAAVTAGLTAAGITGYTASVASSGRCQLVRASAPAFSVEAYGLAFSLAGFGQGYGLKMLVSDDIESFTPTPTLKEDQTITVTPATGKDNSVIVKGYKKGYTAALIDLPEDYEMMALVEGGTIDEDGVYHDPTPAQSKAAPSFELMVLRRGYGEDERQESDLKGYELVRYYNCKGSVGAGAMNLGYDKNTYNLTITNYEDETGVMQGASERGPLDIATDAAVIAAIEAL